MADEFEVLFRTATSPEDPRIKWRGFAPGRTLLRAGIGSSPLTTDAASVSNEYTG